MSNETRTMLVVLLVCGFLMCGCILLPIGVGAMFVLTASRQAQAAQVEARRAMAAEQQARAQAEVARVQAEVAPIPAIPPPEATTPIPGLPTLPTIPTLPAIPADPTIPSPPTIPIPPIAGFPASVPPEVVAAMLADVEQRKSLYKAFKQLRATEEQLKTLEGIDPTSAAIVAAAKQQAEASFTAAGLTREHIDKIMAEGDREGW